VFHCFLPNNVLSRGRVNETKCKFSVSKRIWWYLKLREQGFISKHLLVILLITEFPIERPFSAMPLRIEESLDGKGEG